MRRYRRDDLEAELNKGAAWAVTYGDLMSYMMIFFLIMFSFAVSKQQRPTGAAGVAQKRRIEESLVSIQTAFGGKPNESILKQQQARKEEEQAAKRISEAVQQSNLSKFVEVKQTESKVKLMLKDQVVFDSGRADLKPEAQPLLKQIADQLKGLPNDIVVSGHTDNVPIRHGRYGSNWELSMARAYAVVRFMEEQGVASKRLSGIGYGEHRPVADNATPEGRAQNRRIDIELNRTQ